MSLPWNPALARAGKAQPDRTKEVAPIKRRDLWTFTLLLNLCLLPLWTPAVAQKGDSPSPTPSATLTPAGTPESTPETTPEALPTPTPEPTRTPSPKPGPAGVYISDAGNCRIVHIAEMDGLGYTTFGFPGKGLGRLLHPGQVWVDPKGRIYVADTGNDRIIRMDEFTGRGYVEMPGFKAPEGVASKGDELYVADTGSNQVKVYNDMNGKLLRTYEDKRLDHPVSLWLDENASLYVICGQDPPGGRVVKITEPQDTEGKKWEIYSGEGLRASGFAPSQAMTYKGQLLAVDSSSHRVIKVDNFQGRSPHELGGFGKAQGRFNTPMGGAIDKSGRIYIADTGNDRVVRMDNITGQGWVAYSGTRADRNVELREPTSVFVWCPVPAPSPSPSPKKGEKEGNKGSDLEMEIGK